MNESNDHDWLEKVDSYVDDTLSVAEREAFEQRMRCDERLRIDVERVRSIDAALRRIYAVPELDGRFVAALESGAARESTESVNSAASVEASADAILLTNAETYRAPSAGVRRQWLVAAAAILMCVSAWSWVLLRQSAHPDRGPVYATRPMSEIYQVLVASGFEPKWVCENQQEFADTFRERQGQPLRLAELPAGVEMAGLHYLPALTEQTTAMLARSDGEPVLVFVERADRVVREPEQPLADSGLHLFRKQLAELVMYELTPLARPTVMEFLEAVPVEGAAEE